MYVTKLENKFRMFLKIEGWSARRTAAMKGRGQTVRGGIELEANFARGAVALERNARQTRGEAGVWL